MKTEVRDPVNIAMGLVNLANGFTCTQEDAPIKLFGSVSIWVTSLPSATQGTKLWKPEVPLNPDFALMGWTNPSHQLWVYGEPRIDTKAEEGITYLYGGLAVARVSSVSYTAQRVFITIRSNPFHTPTIKQAFIALWLIEVFKANQSPSWRQRVDALYEEEIAKGPANPFLRALKAIPQKKLDSRRRKKRK